MLWLFLCLTAAGAFGAGMAWGQLKGKSAPGSTGSAPPRALPAQPVRKEGGDVLEDLLALRPGDVVVHLGTDLLVNAVRRLASGDHTLVQAQVGNEGQVIMVANTPFLGAWLCRPERGHAVTTPPAEVLSVTGMEHRRVRRFELREGGAGRLSTQAHFYEGADGVVMWVMVSKEGMDVLCGRSMALGACMVLCAPGEAPT